MSITVMKLPTEIYVQEIVPYDFEIIECDRHKKNITFDDFFNCGFFVEEKGGRTVPVGNLANDGEILSQSIDNDDSWINIAKKKLTTIYTDFNGNCGITRTDRLTDIPNLKTAVSGIPIIYNGLYVTEKAIEAEGYFGTGKNGELYDTWHGFLGIRHGKLVYVAMKCDFGQMCWALVALGIYDAIKLDGGGSFILKNDTLVKSTRENRRINNVGIWR